MTLHTIDVLVYPKESEIIRFKLCVDSSITEKDLLFKIFERCYRNELNNLHRISCCQILEDYEDETNVIPILQNNSRYWFDTPEERDQQYVEYRNEYLSNRI